MNRKQWMVFGIGLILLSFFIGFVSDNENCSELIDDTLKLMDSGADSSELDAWVISCLNTNNYMSLISTIVFTLGILFVICGFLEPKKKK